MNQSVVGHFPTPMLFFLPRFILIWSFSSHFLPSVQLQTLQPLTKVKSLALSRPVVATGLFQIKLIKCAVHTSLRAPQSLLHFINRCNVRMWLSACHECRNRRFDRWYRVWSRTGSWQFQLAACWAFISIYFTISVHRLKKIISCSFAAPFAHIFMMIIDIRTRYS